VSRISAKQDPAGMKGGSEGEEEEEEVEEGAGVKFVLADL
jgi:hypothetical protein